MTTRPDDAALLHDLVNAAGPAHRRALAKAITLIESTRQDDRARADWLLDALRSRTGASLRMGISGPPGVGKSTFIDQLGAFLLAAGHRVAVLAVDPSSPGGGGAILADKTRMEQLSADERAFVRPSPSSGALGGVAETTRDAVLLCEAAGYDVVIVETIGIGQNEVDVASMTDVFVLLQLPNAGDDLQAIKRGVMELVDIVVVNKADVDAAAATRLQAQIVSALRLLRHPRSDDLPHAAGRWNESVVVVSALTGDGIAEFWNTVCRFREAQQSHGQWHTRRADHNVARMWAQIGNRLREHFHTCPAVRAALPEWSKDVRDGCVTPSIAARRLVQLFIQSR